MLSSGHPLWQNPDMTPELCGQQLLVLLAAPTSSPHTIQNIVIFFGRKIKDIRTATAAAPSPDIEVRSTASLRYFSPVICNEVTSILARTSSKSC